MHQSPTGEEPALGIDRGDHGLVRIAGFAVGSIDRSAGEERHRRQIDPVWADRVRNRQSVRLAELEVVGAVPRGDVDEAGSLVGLHKARGKQRHLEIVTPAAQRMARNRSGE